MEVSCTGCGRVLRVADQFAGKEARCPICSAISRVPSATREGAVADEAVGERFFLRTPEGHDYGPVSHAELKLWIEQGRVAADCQIRRQSSDWRPADELYPELKTPAPLEQPRSPAPRPPVQVPLVPHRGALVLLLGILSWLMGCPVLSIVAWSMGANDLAEMRQGRMDPSGMGMTQAGHILGMIYTLLCGAVLLVALCALAWVFVVG